MRAVVDKDTCIGCELCVSICPGVFSMDGEGKSDATTDIPAEMEDDTREAGEQCPVDAIHITE